MIMTDETHPYRVQIRPGFVAAFPATMTADEVQAACRRLHVKDKDTKASPREGVDATE
jgi:hypothetical protein